MKRNRLLIPALWAFVIPFFTVLVACSNKLPGGEPSAKEILKNTTVPADWTVAFEKMTHEFDTIKEQNGPATAVFYFVNRGKDSLTIEDVRASCGCTTPEWTKGAIAPGAVGYVKASYNPANRIGPFDKNVTVRTTGQPTEAILRIHGVVIREEDTPTTEWTMQFDKTDYSFGIIKENGGPVSATFNFVNKGKEPVTISNVTASCGCTTPEWSKEPIAPGASGYVKATYDPLNRIGVFDKTITANTNGNPTVVVFHIKGEVVKD